MQEDKDTIEGRQIVFFTALDPMSDSQEEEYQDLSNPRKVHYKSKWKVFQDAICWITVGKAQDQELNIWQTRSYAIILYDSVPADCIERVVNTKTKEEVLYQKASLSPRLPPKIILKDAWQVQRDGSHQHGTGTGKLVADEEEKELKIDEVIPQPAVAHMIELHSNKSALIKDLLKTDTDKPFSEESKKVIHNLGKRGVLRTMRNFFKDPVFLLFKILGRRRRLLHLWELFGTDR